MENFLKNFHLESVFFVIRAFSRTKLIFLFLISNKKFGQISESINTTSLGFQFFKNLFAKNGTSRGKYWWCIFSKSLNSFSIILPELNVVDYGNHEKLINNCDEYKSLYQKQLK